MKTMIMTRKCPKTSVELIEGNEKSYPYLYPIGDLDQESLHKNFHVCTNQGSLLKSFPANNELKIN
jgi:hypothetical protein